MRIINIVLILSICETFLAASSQADIPCKVDRELEQQCGSYTYTIVKPLLDYIRQVKDEINQSNIKDREIKDLKEKLIQQDSSAAMNKVLTTQMDFQQRTIDRLTANLLPTEQCDQFKRDLVDKDEMIAKLKNDTDNLRTAQLQFEENLKKLRLQEIDLKTFPGIDAFKVQCDSQTAGPGWIVIEQRVNGGESFNRDWATFRRGFGSFDGDFFLGLEKIHRLTNNQSQELYIHMERFDGRVDYARYDRFGIASEFDKYRINILGQFSGTVEDKLRPHAFMKFSTSDSDNDNWAGGSCAALREAGWWFESCVHS
ncbi:hypothetical protein ACLKA6_011178 [Drosophila palustris]